MVFEVSTGGQVGVGMGGCVEAAGGFAAGISAPIPIGGGVVGEGTAGVGVRTEAGSVLVGLIDGAG